MNVCIIAPVTRYPPISAHPVEPESVTGNINSLKFRHSGRENVRLREKARVWVQSACSEYQLLALSIHPHARARTAMSSDTPTKPTDSGAYEPKPVWINTGFAAAQLGGAGVLVAAVQNALSSHNRGAWGIFTRSGGTIAFFGRHARVFMII